jgi:hypothetical protein
MSFSSKPKKVKPKGSVRELKLVQTVSRRGVAAIKTEEDKTPHRGPQKTEATTPRNHSSSPIKRLKFEPTDEQPIPCYLEDQDPLNKRQTMVFIFPHLSLP